MSRDRNQRRLRSAARALRAIDSGGDPPLARALAEALRAPKRDPEAADTLTHPFHAYHPRFHPAAAARLIEELSPDSVLDPFCGSGTVLVEALAAGVSAVGVDINPLAVRIARAKTSAGSAPRVPPPGKPGATPAIGGGHPRTPRVPPPGKPGATPAIGGGDPRTPRVRELETEANRIASEALAAARAARRSGHEPVAHRGDPRRDRALSGWFAPHVRRELETLAAYIGSVRSRDEELGELLELSLSAILYGVSRRTSETDSRRSDRKVARGAASRAFRERVAVLCAGLSDLSALRGDAGVAVMCGDARKLQLPPVGQTPKPPGAVITLIPRAGATDYATQHRLRLAFLGLDPRKFGRSQIGSRAVSAGDPRGAAERMRRDLRACLRQMASAVQGGPIALAAADSVVARRRIAADQMIRDAAGRDLEVVAWAWQDRPKSGRDHILVLRANGRHA